jgi:CubicO group peptidase (beta-lactamase class C family)
VHAALAGNGTLDGVRLLGEDTLARIVEEETRGLDVFTQMPGRFGMGFGLATELIPFPNPRTFFWGGWGGSIVVIDRDERMSFAYVMNRMSQDLAGDVRGAGIIIAAYTALASG